MYYLRARYYNPALGRFINEDTYEGQVSNPLSLNLYSYCYSNPLSYIDPTGYSAKDFMAGLENALDENMTNGLIRWAVNKIMKADHTYQYNSEMDYYAGRVVGDVLSIGSGIKTIVASVAGGGAITIGSGGTLVLGGGTIIVGGVIAGTAELTYGGAVVVAASANLGDDLAKLIRASNKGKSETNKTPSLNPEEFTKLKGNKGYKDKDGNIWKKDQLHKDHWDISNKKGKKIIEVDYDGNEIWPNGPKNKNKSPK